MLWVLEHPLNSCTYSNIRYKIYVCVFEQTSLQGELKAFVSSAKRVHATSLHAELHLVCLQLNVFLQGQVAAEQLFQMLNSV